MGCDCLVFIRLCILQGCWALNSEFMGECIAFGADDEVHRPVCYWAAHIRACDSSGDGVWAAADVGVGEGHGTDSSVELRDWSVAGSEPDVVAVYYVVACHLCAWAARVNSVGSFSCLELRDVAARS